MDTFKQSKELFINMNPKDIPKWDTSKMFYWEQKPEVLLFYEEEYRKIREGINLGGYYMSGWHYFHLNFFIGMYMDTELKKNVIGNLPFDDNTYFLMECYKKAHEEKKGFIMWGTRGFTKSTLLASHEYWTHLVSNTTGNTSMIVYKENSDLEAIKKNFIQCNNKIHPAFRINVISGNDWAQDVTFGTKLKNNTDIITSSIRLINAEGGKTSASEKGAGFTPIGFKIDEIGKFDPRGILKSAMVSFSQQGVYTFPHILSGCVCAGTKVWTNSGKLINIEDLKKEEGILGYDIKNNKVSKEDITYWQPPHKKDCYRITTNKGRTLECSDDHPIYVRDKYENGVFKKNKHSFKEAKYLKEGDHLCIANNFSEDLFGKEEMFDPYLVGLLIGDGTYSKTNMPRITNCDEDVKNYIKSKYETNLFFSEKTKCGRVLEKFTIKGISKEIYNLGIKGQARTTKRLPDNLEKYTKNSIIEMLSGLYDADGCIYLNNNSYNNSKQEMIVKLTSCSKELLEEVRYCLQKLNINGNISYEPLRNTSSPKSTRGHYNLIIKTEKHLKKFADTFNLKIKYKKDKLKEIKSILENRNINGKNKFDYEAIKKIEYIGKKDVYNLTAGTTNTYIANGIITHNTGGNSELSEGAKEILTKPKEWELSVMNWELLNDMVPEEHITWKDDIDREFGTFVPGHMSYRRNVSKVDSTFGELTKYKYKDETLNSLPVKVTPWKEANDFFYEKYDSFSTEDLRNSWRMQLPRNIDDTFLTEGKSSFNKERILKRLSEIKANPKYSLVDLEIDSKNEKITRTFSDKKLAEREYKGTATDAPYMIFDGFPEERPEDYAFVSGSDDYKSEASSTGSLGTIYVLRRRKTSVEKKERIVACLADRPTIHKTLHHKWEKLIRATNALCNLEINDAPFVSFLENDLKVIPYQYLHHFINPYQELVKHNKIGANPSGYKFGVYSNQWNKALMMDAVVDYVNSPEVIDYNEDGSPIFVDGYDYIEDPYLLEEMLDYTDKGGNYDRIMAFGWALVLARYMDSKNITPKESRTIRTSFEKDYRKTFVQPVRKFFGGRGKRSMF